MDLKLKDKVVLVAASSEGLGYSIAEQALKEGARVFIGSRNEEKVRNALNSLRASGRVAGEVLDMAKASSIEKWVDTAIAAFGSADGLVVNAGGPPPGGFEAFSDEDWQKAFELTLLSAVRLVRAVLPVMKKKGAGSILTLTSITVKEPWPRLLLSGIMRAGVVSLVKSLSQEYGPLGIRVHNLAPGRIYPNRLRKLDEAEAGKNGIGFEEQRRRNDADIALKRAGVPEEFGRAAVFLLSDAASYINGVTLMADGGLSKTLW